MKWTLALTALVAVNAFGAGAPAQPALGIDRAKSHASAAIANARAKSVFDVAVAVVDANGTVIYVERLDGARADASDAAIGKARSAAKAGASAASQQGGAALTEGGKVIGAVGVSSGANATQNQEIASAGTKTLDTSRMEKVTFIPAAEVETGYNRFATIVNGVGYWVITSRRTAPGEAEVHTTDADIIYVIEGSATFVTGGELVEARNTSPIELRAKSIAGGEEHRLTKGDLITVPKGVPHWFKAVDGKFSYYVVKAKS
jgi:uncharacterized protein GlcG (DUF336 family)/uncharacterized RmlC-like cupin family protein